MFSLSSIIKKIFVIPSFILLLILMSKPKALASPIINNANDVSFTVSWISTTPTTCEVRYGPTPSLGKTAYDVRGANNSGNIHYVEISDLQPKSTYYFDVLTGSKIDNNEGMHYSFVTGPTSGASLISDTAYGQVVLPDSTKAKEALVYVTIRDNDGQVSSGRSTTLSSLVESGYWNVQLTNARLLDMSALFNYSLSGDILEISVYASDGSATNIDVDTGNDTPAPQVQINDTCTEEVYDYVDNDCDGLVDETDAQGCTIFFRDMDGDGYGVTGDSLCLSAQEAEYRAIQGGDPDDLDPQIIPCTVDMEISAGWSLISLPLTPNNSRLSVLFPEAMVVYCYKKDIGYERVKPEEVINVGIGYWILLDQQQSYSLDGQVLNNYTLVVENGWYMIGGCTSPAQSSVNTGNISVIYSYVAGSGYQRIQDTENLEPGNGYWILLKDIIDKAKLKVSNPATSACEGDMIIVDAQSPARGFPTVEAALACLNQRRLTRDVELIIAPGTYEPFKNESGETQPLIIDHPDAHRFVLRGESRMEISLTAFNSYKEVLENDGKTIRHYKFKYNLNHSDWTMLVAKLNRLPPGASAYGLIRRTRKPSESGGLNHLIHRGIWRLDSQETKNTRDRLVVELMYQPSDSNGNGELPMPLDAEFSATTPPVAVILTSVLKFSCSAGVVVDSTVLGEMRNLVIAGDYSSSTSPPFCAGEKQRKSGKWSENFAGIEARRGAGITLGRYVGISAMDGQGVSAFPSSWIVADRTAASSNQRRGFYPTLTGAMVLNQTIASGNQTDGYVADHSAYLEGDGLSAVGNGAHGFNALFGGQLKLVESVAARNNQRGFTSIGGGNLWIDGDTANSHALYNGSFGLHAEIGGRLSAKNLTIQGNDASFSQRGVKIEAGAVYAIGDTVDNRDTIDIATGATAVQIIPAPEKRRFLKSREEHHIHRGDDLFNKTHVTIDPTLSNPSDVQSLHHFFNIEGPNTIAGKRIAMPHGAYGLPLGYVNVNLSPGIHVYKENPIIITHPDAKRVRIQGQSCEIDIATTMPPLLDCGDVCREVKLEIKSSKCESGPVVGDLLAIHCSGSKFSGIRPHWVHRGVWQVSATNVNNNPNRIKVRNFGGDALIGADLSGPSYIDKNQKYTARLMKTVLYFPDSTGGIVVDGTALGELRDVVLVGPNFKPIETSASPWTSLDGRITTITQLPGLDRTYCMALGYAHPEPALNEKSGLKIQNCGHAYFYNVAVTGFIGSGVRVSVNSTLSGWPFTNGFLPIPLVSSNNAKTGMTAFEDSTIWAKYSVATANKRSGFYAADDSTLYVSLSTAAANRAHGFEARDSGYIEAGRGVAIRNRNSGVFINDGRFSGPRAAKGGALPHNNATISAENGMYGYKVEGDSTVALDGAWAFKHDKPNRAGVHISERSKCRCRWLTLVQNDYPIKAMTNAMVSAGDSLCVDNTYYWFTDSASTPPASITGTCETCDNGAWAYESPESERYVCVR